MLVTQLCSTLCHPMECDHQAPLSMKFSRQECWSELPFPSPGDLPDPGIEYRSPALQAVFFFFPPLSEPPGKLRNQGTFSSKREFSHLKDFKTIDILIMLPSQKQCCNSFPELSSGQALYSFENPQWDRYELYYYYY